MSQKAVIKSNLVNNITSNLIKFWQISTCFLLLLILVSLFEVLWISSEHGISADNQYEIFLLNFLNTLEWGLYTVGVFFIVLGFTGLLFPGLSYFLYRLMLSLLVISQLGLVFYFSETLVPLGADLFTYSVEDLKETVQAAGALNATNLAGLVIILVLFYLLFGLGRYFKFRSRTVYLLSILSYMVLIVLLFVPVGKSSDFTGLEENLADNKSLFFYEEAYEYFSTSQNIYFDFYLAPEGNENALVQKTFLDPNYPFLHLNEYPDMLGTFFHEFDTVPDLVFVVVEGLGKAYSGKNAYLGSWTPFLDSLSEHGLYWENTLSTTGRTFGVLPGLFGSLPFGQNGFMEVDPFPYHETLLSILKENGYQVNYFIGADEEFDNAKAFLNYQKIDLLVDIDDFDPDFDKSPDVSGFSWGYADKETFSNGLRKLPVTNQPQVNIFQTMSSHSPFTVPDQAFYNKKFQDFLAEKRYKHPTIDLSKYQKELASILYVDDALKGFFQGYLKRPKAENTIFIITGDHRLPEIPMSTKIDRFHVPLLIYSPNIKRPKTMEAVNTHFEVAPSLLAYLDQYQSLQLPDTVAWRGYVLDTAAQFQSHVSHALMRNKYQFGDYIDGEYFMSDDQLFKIMENLYIEPVQMREKYDPMRAAFEEYKGKDAYVITNNSLLPK
ncbi:hypothetical protein GCM10028791_02220 [Echinicola sediminis]